MAQPGPGKDQDKPLEAGARVQHYEVQGLLASGGFGRVYTCFDTRSSDTVAMKVLKARHSKNKSVVARFLSEAKVVFEIQHENIVDVFDMGTLDDGRPYFVMELLDGETLDSYLLRRGQLTADEALEILRPIADALDTVHQQGIIHRDLKPTNVFLQRLEGGGHQPKILDFGVAKLDPSMAMQVTLRGLQLGTPQYMSPEQCRGGEIDSRTDVYAFGILAYELLTGVVPFDSKSPMDVFAAQVSKDPPRPSAMAGGIPRDADTVILQMLEKEQGKRPDTLRQAVEALAVALASAPKTPSSGRIRTVPQDAPTLEIDPETGLPILDRRTDPG